jgi:diguanylate cyclase (GGDEF)-like protein
VDFGGTVEREEPLMAGHLSSQDHELHLLLDAGRVPEANTLFDHVLARAPASTDNRPQRATVLVDRAVTAWRLRRIPLALELAAEGWTELEAAAPEGPLAARALGQLADLLEGIGSHRASLDMLRLAVQVARSASDPAMLAHCLQRLAGCLNFRAIDEPRDSAEAAFGEAGRLGEEGLALPECADHVRRALLATYGRSLAGLGALRRAEQVAAQALDLGGQADDRRCLAVGNWVLALVRRQQGKFTEARALASSAVTDAEQLDDDNLLLRFSLDLAEICAELNDDVGESVALRRSVTAGRTIMKTLQAGLGQALEQRRLAVKAQRIAEAAEEAAARDPLTGLANRLGLERAAPPLLERTAADGRVSWLALVDIDWFKRVNDEAGHAAGDAMLREIAQLLRKDCRTEDLVVRWAGDEFVVLLVDGTDEGRDTGPVLAERIRATVEGHDWTIVLGTARGPTVSIGVAAGSAKLDRLFAAADIALYRAKRRGRNRVEVHPLVGGNGAG